MSFVLLIGLCASSLIWTANSQTCHEVKRERRFKTDVGINCPDWEKCADCDWIAQDEGICRGPCGGGTTKFFRERTCTFENLNSNEEECTETQFKIQKCDMKCGNGVYNVEMNRCDCKMNWTGECCNIKITACESPIIRRNEHDRNVNFRGRNNRCDAVMRPGWYRFIGTAGDRMPERCAPYGSCNTAVPFWLNGTHPTKTDQVVDRIACGTGDNGCCDHQIPIKVINCGHFMAYYLRPTKGCMKAYCIGDREKCPEGQSSEDGFEPGCSNNFPDIKLKPQISVSVNKADQNRLLLVCSSVISENDEKEYVFKANWYFNNLLIATDNQTGAIVSHGVLKFQLKESYWMQHVGKNASCIIQARRKTLQGTWSKDGNSEERFIGITVSPLQLRVKEGESGVVTLIPTIPVVCSEQKVKVCRAMVSLKLDPTVRGPRCSGQKKEIAQVVFQHDGIENCGLEVNKTGETKVKVQPKLDGQFDKTQRRILRMKILSNDETPEIWRGYVLPPVEVIVDDSDQRYSTCSIRGDPHFNTFDRRSYSFYTGLTQFPNNSHMFTLYKHRTIDEEVQARFTSCGGTGSYWCSCGVAVRVGRSTLAFDRCVTRPSLIPQYGPTKPDPRMMLYTQKSGTEYHIFLASGTKVRVEAGISNIVQIYVDAAVSAKNQTSGLCGNYNGDPKDDLEGIRGIVCQNNGACKDEDALSRMWYVPRAESAFAHYLPPRKEPHQGMFCECISGGEGVTGLEQCSFHSGYETCDPGKEISSMDSTSYTAHGKDFPWLTNYQIPKHSNPIFQSAVSSSFYYTLESQLQTQKNWTTDSAREYCRNKVFLSPAIVTCMNEVPAQDYNDSIKACTEDLVMTGNTMFALQYIEEIKQACMRELNMNIELWEPRVEENETEGDKEKELIISGPPIRLIENLCPNECSGHGACLDGTCQCEPEYANFDCSLKRDEIPVLRGVVSTDLPCDSAGRRCDVIAIEGINYVERDELSCHYYTKGPDTGNYFFSDPPDTPELGRSPGNMFSIWVVQCTVPANLTIFLPHTTYWGVQVAVSNDGKRQSERALYTSYNSICETCIEGKCTRKEDTCIIGGRCYRKEENNPENQNQACYPEQNRDDWSEVTTTGIPTTTEQAPSTKEEDDGIVCTGRPNETTIHQDLKNCRRYFVCEGTKKHHFFCPDNFAFHRQQRTCIKLSLIPGCK